jgi:chromatin remodeling complex protein RSC6
MRSSVHARFVYFSKFFLNIISIFFQFFFNLFLGEEWGKKRRKGKGRRKRKLSDSDEASFSSDDSDAGKKKYKDKTPLTGFTKPLKLSEDLEEIVGLKEASRGEVIKQMWAYIKVCLFVCFFVCL